MCKIIKRDGREDDLNRSKIFDAICAAVNASGEKVNKSKIKLVTSNVLKEIREKEVIKVESIDRLVEANLSELGLFDTARAYREYRTDRSNKRAAKSALMKSIHAIGIVTDRDNANVGNNFSAKLLRIASESNKWHMLATMPKELARLHENGDLYIHDLDSYNLTTNCLHIPTDKMLEKGFNTGYGFLRKPKRIDTAADLTCILMQSSQNDMFGGQSHPNFDCDLADYLEATREEVTREVEEVFAVRNM